MRLQQFHAIKVWHGQHGGHALEKAVWDAVLTLWLLGWVGGPTAFMLHRGWAEAACIAAVFVPGAYVSLRRGLHRTGLLRCDWIVALR